MQPRCWAKRCPGDFLFWKMITKQIHWDLSPSCCSEPEIPEEKMNSCQSQWWHHFKWIFTTLLALLRCCNSSSWSWTGESVHLESGRRSLKRLMVQLVKFLHLKVHKYSGNVSKRKFEGVLLRSSVILARAPKQDQPNHSCRESLASPEVFEKQGR